METRSWNESIERSYKSCGEKFINNWLIGVVTDSPLGNIGIRYEATADTLVFFRVDVTRNYGTIRSILALSSSSTSSSRLFQIGRRSTPDELRFIFRNIRFSIRVQRPRTHRRSRSQAREVAMFKVHLVDKFGYLPLRMITQDVLSRSLYSVFTTLNGVIALVPKRSLTYRIISTIFRFNELGSPRSLLVFWVFSFETSFSGGFF